MRFSVFFAVAFLATAVISLDLGFSPTNFDFPLTPNHFPKGLGAGNGSKPTSGRKRISDLKSFANEYDPLLPSTSGAPRTSEERDAKRHESGVEAEGRFSKTKTKFMVKHLFEGGASGGEMDSFKMFSEDPEFFKKYIVKQNMQLPYGRMLNGGSRPDFDTMKEKTTSIIDTEIELLDADVKEQFTEWEKSGNKGKALFTTKSKYRVTDIIYKPHITEKGERILQVSIVQREVQLKLGTNSEGEIIHYEGAIIEDGEEPLHKAENFAHYEASEVEAIVEQTKSFNKALGWSNSKNRKATTNNDRFAFESNNPEFKNLADAFDENVKTLQDEIMKETIPESVCKPSARRKRAVGNCAIFMGEDGQVEKILSEEFLEAYEAASEKDKRKLTELAKDHMDKIQNEDEAHSATNRKEISKRIQAENFKSHVASMNDVGNVHDLKTESFHNDFSESVENLHNKLISTKSKVKLSSSKVSQKLAYFANDEYAKYFGKGMASMSESFGKFFLAKTVITGIIHGDTTSLAIVGGRFGYDYATKAGVWAGTKFFTRASKVGRFTRVLGKVAGPIGAIADMGLGIWSLTKSVGRLKNATNKYDRNDAIADVVMDSVDIATTATVTAVSVFFPFLAPVAVEVGIVITILNQMVNALFHAGNDVARINSEVPLMDFEKEYVFTSRLFDIFGTRGKDYLEFLFEEEQANRIAVQQNLEVLKGNPSLYGIVFPSRTMAYDGGCTLWDQFCVTFIFWCLNWADKSILKTGCDLNKKCFADQLCRDYSQWEHSKYWAYTCECDKPANTSFGFPRANSMVDFREKRTLFWERSVPDDVEGAYFKCKPGSEQSQGYTVHEEDSQNDYLCENAIALLQPPEKRPNATFMLFDLGNGTDTVYAGNDAPTNLFIVGNGTKHFEGGDGCRNEFLLDEYCQTLTGTFIGGKGGGDALTASQNCSKGQWLEFDFNEGTVKNQADDLNITFSGMDEVNGRENEAEHLIAGCELRKAVLGGGTTENHDRINISAGDGCKYNLTALLGNFTEVYSKASLGTITLVVGDSFKSVSAALDVHSRDSLTLPVVFQSAASSHVNLESFVRTENTLSLAINKVGSEDSMNLTLNFQSGDLEQAVYFTETPVESPDSILFLTPASPPMFYHSLPETEKIDNRERNGCSNTANMFDITGESWRVTGGDQDDNFVLHSSIFTAINGKGGDNTLGLHPDIKTEMTIDLTNKTQLNNIQIVTGAPEQPVTVITECSTKMVATMGGSQSKPDKIIVPAKPCFERELKIVAIGNLHVDVSSEVGPVERDNITVIVPTSKNASAPVQLEVAVQKGVTNGLIVAVQISHLEWKAELDLKPNQDTYQVQLKEIKGNGSVALSLPKSNAELPYIDISKVEGDEPSGRLWVDLDASTVQVIYELNGDKNVRNVKAVSGLEGVSNAFRFASGSWKATGGNESDVFVILPEALLGELNINGGNGGDNLLVLESDSSESPTRKIERYAVLLEEKYMGFGGYHPLGRIQNVQHVVGRPALPDEIHVACDTKTVNGRGGGGNKGFEVEDAILIKGNGCGAETETEIHVEKFTRVKNTAEYGIFKYFVSDIFTSWINVKPLASNLHLIKFGFQPWEKFSQISFDETPAQLGFWSKGRTDTFPMFRNNASSSSDYTNPIFQFHQAGSNVIADVQVSKEGIVALTFGIHEGGLGSGDLVKGLTVDVNRYLINVTEKRNDPDTGGSIIGSSLASVNQFWIFEMESMLNTLDGGDCSDCRNYLQLTKSFQTTTDLEIQLNKKNGYIKSSNRTLIKQLVNIHELRGREGNAAQDKVVLSSCDVRQISEAEEIVIQHDRVNDCAFNLTMEIGPNTMVWFEDPSTRTASMRWINSTFHYHFTSPRSFDLNGSSSLAWLGPIHNYYLSFTVDDLDWIRFDLEEQQLNYSIGGNEYHHSMILGATYEDPFFSQPSMITSDSFKIQIGRDGSILFTMGSGSSLPEDEMSSSIMPTFDSVAKRLGVTFILQTKSQFLFVGHGNLEGSRNMLENLNNTVSFLGGGGADDTIYDITSLNKDVFIYPGFESDSNQANFSSLAKQTLDLTDIVFPIRKACNKKYLPSVVVSQEKDLVIVMDGYEGKVIIVGGAHYQVSSRIQLLLGHAIMELVPDPAIKEWKIRPAPIIIPEGTIYTIAKEDVEDNHEIRIVENGPYLGKSVFECIKNGTDLYVTNIQWKVENDKHADHPGHFEITTIIVTDFLANESVSNNLPNVVSGVTLSLPGLNIMLEGNKVIPTPGASLIYSKVGKKVPILEWEVVLHGIQKYISEESPVTFKESKPFHEHIETQLGNDSKHSPSFFWELVGGVIGFGLMLLLTLVCFFVIKMKMTRRSGYEQL